MMPARRMTDNIVDLAAYKRARRRPLV